MVSCGCAICWWNSRPDKNNEGLDIQSWKLTYQQPMSWRESLPWSKYTIKTTLMLWGTAPADHIPCHPGGPCNWPPPPLIKPTPPLELSISTSKDFIDPYLLSTPHVYNDVDIGTKSDKESNNSAPSQNWCTDSNFVVASQHRLRRHVNIFFRK